MPTERIQRQIDRLLDQADQAMEAGDWATVRMRAEAALRLDDGNADALAYLAAASKDAAGQPEVAPTPAPAPLPVAFVNGRYRVQSLLGEGGKKVVYRAHDTLLKRDVAFALIKTDGLDAAGRERVKREAQALGQLSAHPNIVSVFDLGEEQGQPYIVTELLGGGDLCHLIAAAPDHTLPLPHAIEIAVAVGKALAFAHGKGVIHRDLKPGNVWLAEDGTPKLGDFGLAVSRSDVRLTRVGMMVGTVLYMSPEQAAGGEVTARTDLYSLGCVLYELIAGRPPFVGDESVAIIGQHLHANPVSPSWHRPECPPALEALILRLLEKNPTQRPASALQVVEALSLIERPPTRPPAQPEGTRFAANNGGALTRGGVEDAAGAASGQIGSPLSGRGGQRATAARDRSPSPVYQRAFVGREAELRQLEGAFDAAVAGHGGLALVVGEPGIGKTTITEQLATYAGLRGGRVLVGHCYEEGSLSLPYLAFVEAIRSYVLDREPAALRSELGAAGPEVARIVSEVRDRVQITPVTNAGDGAEDRYRLLHGVTSFLRNAGQVQPLVIVLEDLHDADRGTLDLLQFLARQLTGTRLLVVGTYRDVEVDRAHPLSATLAELQRGASFLRIRLRGLTADEVQRMIAAIGGQAAPWRLAEAVYRQTEGNPLFVQEVVRYLAESGLVERKDGRWQAPSAESLLTSIPEGLRDVIGRRLARLTPSCNQLLTVAAIIGREFELRTLQAVAGVSDDALTSTLDEALKVAILQDQSRPGRVRYRFAHAFFRQTLYEEVITPRRLRLHQQIARALEAQYAGRLAEHAAELADHFAQSSDPADLLKAVEYGRLAARRARAVYAHGEAARLLEQALAVQEVADADARAERCAILLELAETLIAASEPFRAAREVAEAAYGLAEELGDWAAMQRACRTGAVGMLMGGQSPAVATPVGIRWVDRLDALALPGTAERAIADAMRAHVCWVLRRYDEMHRLLVGALATAREVDDEEVLWVAGWCAVWLYGAQGGEAWRLQVAEEFATRERRGVSTLAFCATVWIAGEVLLNWGRRPEAEAAFGRAVTAAGQSGEALLQVSMALPEALLLRIDGRLEESIACAQRIAQGGEELGSHSLHPVSEYVVADRSRMFLGRVDDVMLRSPFWWQVVGCLAVLGRVEEGRALLHKLLREHGTDDADFRANAWYAAWLLEAAVLLDDADAARLLAQRLDLLAGTASSEYAGPCIPRLLGGAAALNGDRDRAQAYYEQALEMAGRIGYRPEIALTHLGLAELLNPPAADVSGTNPRTEASNRDLAEAREHLAFCIAEFEAMGMAPALQWARTLEATLNAAAAGAPRATGSPAGSDAASRSTPSIGGRGARPESGHVFISYSSEDKPHAEALVAMLEAEGTAVWLDRRSIAGGTSWDTEIVRGIRSCAAVVVLCTPAAMRSPNVQQELRLALEYRRPLLPLLLAPTDYPDEVKYALAGRQHIDILDQPEQQWQPRVLTALRRLLEHSPQSDGVPI